MNSFLIANPNKCIGCRTCEIACVLAHAPADALTTGEVDKEFHPRLSVVKTKTVSVPVQCRHCEDAPCANVCPHGAIINKNDTIQIDLQACIGCKNCLMACPIGAIDLAHQTADGQVVMQSTLKIVDENGEHSKEKLVAYKCDLCIGRPEGPACKSVCPTQAFTAVEGKIMTLNTRNKRKASAKELANLAGGQHSSRS